VKVKELINHCEHEICSGPVYVLLTNLARFRSAGASPSSGAGASAGQGSCCFVFPLPVVTFFVSERAVSSCCCLEGCPGPFLAAGQSFLTRVWSAPDFAAAGGVPP
jgi:hypothetical protein